MSHGGTSIRRTIAGAVVLLAFATACSGAEDAPEDRPASGGETSEPSPAPEPDAAPSVLVVSLDGLSPRAVRDLGPVGTPNLHRMLDEGAGTLNARAAYERTVTLPNHTSMLTGRPIDPVLGGHGVNFNDDHPGTIHEVRGDYVASIFDVVHDSGGSTAFYSTKSKFDFLDRSWSEAGAEDSSGKDDGTDKIDTYVRAPAAEVVGLAAEQLLADPATFTFLHVGTLDDVGHRRGWGSRGYLRAVERVDHELGTLLAAADVQPGLTVLVTSDHGGTGPGHLEASDPANYVVPLLVRGPGVPAGVDLYSLSDAYADPGDTRPTYDGPQPLRNALVANLAAGLLDLPAVPGSTVAADRGLIRKLRAGRS